MKNRLQQSGFSLIELIVVVVLLGILGSVGGLLILQPIEAYDDQVRRQQLVDQGEMALRQIARDVRRALPNSLRVSNVGSGWAVEMVNTVDAARYRDDVGAGFAAAANRLQFIPPGDSSFNLLGQFPTITPPATLASNLRLVIYSTSSDAVYDDASANLNSGIITSSANTINVAEVSAAGVDNEFQITLANAHRFPLRSPQQRVFLVDGPVSYVCNPATGQIVRYANYSYRDRNNQPQSAADFSGGNSGLVVSQVNSCDLTYQAGTSQRAGVLTVSIEVEDSGESINLLHQINVVNVP